MATITIELDFEHLQPEEVTPADVYDYLKELIDDESLGYAVKFGTASDFIMVPHDQKKFTKKALQLWCDKDIEETI